jgi:hypothetical protein
LLKAELKNLDDEIKRKNEELVILKEEKQRIENDIKKI